MSPKRLSRVIKTLREKKGLSQKALAERVGVTDAYITMLETGTRKNPSLDVLKRLAKVLGVPVTELLE
jgi:transcriptional regulator with XRE-family HTH domain